MAAWRRNKRKLAVAALVCLRILRRKRQERSKKKRVWKKEHNKRHLEQGYYNNLVRELKENDESSFKNFARLYPDIFDDLLKEVTPLIQRKDTFFRKSISAGERLSITLRFLATGETFKSLSYQYRIGETTIGKMVPETCTAIYEVLKKDYFKCPSTPQEWQSVADRFQSRWNFPNCVGALDGKHIAIRPPFFSGSTYFNYKHSFSIVLMALVDADYKFLYCDIGCNGRISDGGVFRGCSLSEALEKRTSHFPDPKPAPGDERSISHFIVADEAFPLKEYLMKPFAQRSLTREKRIFKYRLSRARRVVENAFGILANRFRVFLSTIYLPPGTVEKLVLAAICLHNMLRVTVGHSYGGHLLDREDSVTHCVIPGAWRQDPDLQKATIPVGTNQTNRAKALQEYLCTYVNSSVGSVPWQWDRC